MPPLPELQPIATNGAYNLPAQVTKLVGRSEALRVLARQLSEERFLTIVGPGGVGKTSVALAVAEAVAADYEHGVWLVDLAHLSDPTVRPARRGKTGLDRAARPRCINRRRSVPQAGRSSLGDRVRGRPDRHIRCP